MKSFLAAINMTQWKNMLKRDESAAEFITDDISVWVCVRACVRASQWVNEWVLKPGVTLNDIDDACIDNMHDGRHVTMILRVQTGSVAQ